MPKAQTELPSWGSAEHDLSKHGAKLAGRGLIAKSDAELKSSVGWDGMGWVKSSGTNKDML